MQVMKLREHYGSIRNVFMRQQEEHTIVSASHDGQIKVSRNQLRESELPRVDLNFSLYLP